MTQDAYLTITNVVDGGPAFAIVHGDGRSCYIPPHLAYMHKFAAGDLAKTEMTDNPKTMPTYDRTPFVAVSIERVAPIGEALVVDESLYDAVDALLESGAPLTAEQAHKQFAAGKWPQSSIEHVLETLFKDERCGKIARWAPGAPHTDTVWYAAYPEAVDMIVGDTEGADA